MNYLIAFFGSFIYNFALFVKAKDNCDKNDTPFPYGKYFKMNWDNWAFTVLLAPVLVLYLPDIVAILNQRMDTQITLYPVYNLGAGPLTEVVLFGIYKMLGWKDTWVAPVHKEQKEPVA